MFYRVFQSDPSVPDDWDMRHLWAAQTILAAGLAAAPERYRPMDDADEWRAAILADFEEICASDWGRRFFVDQEFESRVHDFIGEFVAFEAPHAMAFLQRSDATAPDAPSPEGADIIAGDQRLARYIADIEQAAAAADSDISLNV